MNSYMRSAETTDRYDTGVVHEIDTTLSTIDCLRKSIKTINIFFHLLDLSIYEARVVYKRITGRNEKFSKFHVLRAKETLGKYSERRVNQTAITESDKDTDNIPFPITDRHFVSKCLSLAVSVTVSVAVCVEESTLLLLYFYCASK